jgi:hypothetical protein
MPCGGRAIRTLRASSAERSPALLLHLDRRHRPVRLAPRGYNVNLYNWTSAYERGKPTPAPYQVYTDDILGMELPREENKKIYDDIDGLQEKYIKRFPVAQAIDRRLGTLELYGTRSISTA